MSRAKKNASHNLLNGFQLSICIRLEAAAVVQEVANNVNGRRRIKETKRRRTKQHQL